MLSFFRASSLRLTVRTCLLGLGVLAAEMAQAQAPRWQAVATTTAAVANPATVLASTTDAAGNVYLTGSFSGTVAFGTTTLTSAGDADVFVAKWDPVARSFVWAQRAGGAQYDYVDAIALSGTSIYIAGSYASPTAAFGPVSLTNVNNRDDVFVAKLTDNGTTASFAWAQRAGGDGGDAAYALAVAGNQVYVGGSFGNFGFDAQFGAVTLIKANTGSVNGEDAFVTKLIDNGSSASFVWAQRAGGVRGDGIEDLAVSGNAVYAVGYFASPTADFGSTTLVNATSSGGIQDAFVTKLTDNGSSASFAWAQQAGGGGISRDGALAVAAQGTALYVAGLFSSTATFGSTTFTSAGSSDVFVAKLTDTGTGGSFNWAQQLGGANDEMVNTLLVRGPHVLVSGSFWSPTASFGATTLTNAGQADAFVAKLTDGGSAANFDWALSGGGSGYDNAAALALSGSTIYVAGSATPPSLFGNQLLTTPAGTELAYVTSLVEPALRTTEPAWAAGLTVYPNPARDVATVRLPPSVGPATLTVTDALGRTVRTQPVTTAAGRPTELPLWGLTPGLYQLRVQIGAHAANRTLVID